MPTGNVRRPNELPMISRNECCAPAICKVVTGHSGFTNTYARCVGELVLSAISRLVVGGGAGFAGRFDLSSNFDRRTVTGRPEAHPYVVRSFRARFGRGVDRDGCRDTGCQTASPLAEGFAMDMQSPHVEDTFAGLMTWLTDGLDRSLQSFPSAHTATAFGLAIGLVRIYPRARWLFFCLATLAAVQRLEAGAHFLSDVCAGAALGLFVAGLATDRRVLGGWFDRLEKE